jgi:MFS family permease
VIPPIHAVTIPASERQRTLRLSVREGFLWSIMWGFGDAYISPYAIHLQASPTEVALLGSVPALIGAIGQWVGASLMERHGRRRGLLVAMILAQGLTFLPLVFLPLIFPNAGALCVLVTYTVASLLFGGIAPLWTSLMGDVVPDDERGRYYGARTRVVNFGMLTSMLAAAFIMSWATTRDQRLAGFTTVFLVAALARTSSAWLMHRHADPPGLARPTHALTSPAAWLGMMRAPYFPYLILQTLLGASFAIAAPFFGLYMLRDLGWTYPQFTAATVVFFVAQMFFAPWWGRLCDRHGSRSVLIASGLLIALPHLLWFGPPHFYYLLWVQALNGAFSSGFGLASGNYFFEHVPAPDRARVVSLQTLVNSAANLLAAGWLGAWLARQTPPTTAWGGHHLPHASSLPYIFLLAGLLRLALSLWLLPRLKEIRAQEPIAARDIIRRFLLAEPLREQMTGLAVRFTSRR